MTKKVTYDTDTLLVTAAYDLSTADYQVPEPSAEISDAEWSKWMQGGAWTVVIDGDDVTLAAYIAPPEPLDRAQARTLRAMERWIAELLSPFTAGVPDIEVQSWSEKARAARDHIGGTPSPMIEAEAAVTGEDAMTLAQTIKDNAERYERIIAQVTGLRRSTRAAIEAAGDPADLPGILEAAQAQALALGEAEGIV